MTAQSEDLPIIEFVSPMPGFPDHRAFLLVRLDDDGLLYALTSVMNPELRFLVMPPLPFFPDYAPEISDETLELLGITDAEQVLTLLVVTPGETAADATANLLAPILIQRESRHAAQVVLAGSGLPVRAELMARA
jgi:flagellar assembly factor FliW